MSDVEFVVHSGIGRITLNRPRALNALTHVMVTAIAGHLERWRADPAVRVVVVEGAGERGLCAGGDIRSIYEDARSGGTASLAFWADEYRLNAAIARYPKPYLAIMDGLVMGGGVGVSAHGSHRVVTDRSRVAMPETGIGFVPDVGGTYLLSRAPGGLGLHAGLTGAQLSGADAIHCGLADHYVLADRLPDLFDALATHTPDAALALVADPPPPSALAEARSWIDHCYAADTVEGILDRLRDAGGPAIAAAKELEGKSPTTLKVTLRALRTAAALPDLEAALTREYRVSHHALTTAELVEGIRAQVIDKDRAPRWSPQALTEVGEDLVDAYFAHLGEDELTGVAR
ncbi:enoyl-CoA hydratase/isomerase family protein [Amycolatopsis sp. PS_44_ISF1]|uniref:enoyl-CoA hydratase/isomerase family protein n=1 Tax=Amycolatopsis sp. PS_44_ISF1 TaxID=2974917 RepID=UPI0028DD5106|nr:enoyl-CoA hydratase/isomerase family protein [Amycolatopsis sp. PS_44_ISF1]MDT8913208.1 enoyl-CoA hydratase/isomerase family protein [Amycolatopsis sp. PS_44_ISF1]MDT8916259.1 enoyl-CoA hydratase/isomerase family protein [Amycolatopsis sp. PS_44_ISF1]